MEGLKPSFEVFDRCVPMRMIQFLTTLRETFDTIGVSEAAAVRFLAYFLGTDTMHVLSKKVFMTEVDFDGGYLEASDQGSQSHVVHEFLRRFIPEEVLQNAY